MENSEGLVDPWGIWDILYYEEQVCNFPENYTQELFEKLNDPDVVKVVQFAPSVRAAIGEAFDVGDFEAMQAFSSGGRAPVSIVAADFSGDGRTDLYQCSLNGSRRETS